MNVFKYFYSKKSLKRKILDIKEDIKKITKSTCDEKIWINCYGVYDIEPKQLVFWICIETDAMKLKLKSNDALKAELRNLLITHEYPETAIPFVFIDFESKETVDRESSGSWYLHFK
jgi:hypothetical protein